MQESSESIATFIARAREALRFLQSTRPPPPHLAPPSGTAAIVTYSLEDSDRELLISVLLNGTKYSALTTSSLCRLRMLSKMKRHIVLELLLLRMDLHVLSSDTPPNLSTE